MMATPTPIATGRFYRFGNKASGKALNHYAPGGSNVNVYAEDGSKDQIWALVGTRLYPESNPGKCLDRYVGSDNYNNADVYTPNDSTNQLLTFEPYSQTIYGYYYYIKLTSGSFYLTQVGNDVKWTTSPSGDSSIWLAEEVRRVTGIPNPFGTGTVTDYFAIWSGYNNGAFPSSTSITNLHQTCFGNGGTNSSKYQNLYGAIFSAAGSQAGKFHTGVDLSPGSGTPVKAPASGQVVYSSTNYGTVTIKETGTNRLFLCLHMANRVSVRTPTEKGTTQIGTVSGIGGNGAMEFSPHLHVEIHPANTTQWGDSYEANSFNQAGNAVPVQDYF